MPWHKIPNFLGRSYRPGLDCSQTGNTEATISESPGPFLSFFVGFMDYLGIWYIKHETQCFKAFKTPLKQYEVFQKTSRFSDPYSNKKNVLSSIWCWLSKKNIWWKEKNLGIQRQVVYNRYINTPRCMNFYTFGSQLSSSWEWYFSTSVMSAKAFSNHQRDQANSV